MKKKMNNKGFTLVELLAVVVVLAIVAAIAMQTITGIIKNSRIDSFISSAITVAESAELSCAQSEDISLTKDYIKKSESIDNITISGSNITITPKGDFAKLKADDIMEKANDKFNGKTYGTLSCNKDANGKVTTCTLNYTCSSETY